MIDAKVSQSQLADDPQRHSELLRSDEKLTLRSKSIGCGKNIGDHLAKPGEQTAALNRPIGAGVGEDSF